MEITQKVTTNVTSQWSTDEALNTKYMLKLGRKKLFMPTKTQKTEELLKLQARSFS